MEKFSGCEALEIAIQIEKNGKDYYLELAENTDNANAVDIFKYLAEAEDQHIVYFRDVFSKVCDQTSPGSYPDEYYSYMRALAGQHIFTQKDKGREVARSVKDYREGIDLGIQFEKDSILFYSEMKKMMPENDRESIENIINEEKKHLRDLCGLREVCDNEKC